MIHFVQDMDLNKQINQLEMAEKICLNIIHEGYDKVKDKVVVSDEILDRIYKSVKTLHYIRDLKRN